MAVVEFAVPVGDFGGRGEEGLGAIGITLFAGEGADFDGRFGEDLDAVAEADVGFLGGVGIHEIDGDVFVAHGFGAKPGGGFGGSGGGLGRVGGPEGEGEGEEKRDWTHYFLSKMDLSWRKAAS